MTDDKLHDYIRKSLKKGVHERHIHDSLVALKWESKHVNDSIMRIKYDMYKLNRLKNILSITLSVLLIFSTIAFLITNDVVHIGGEPDPEDDRSNINTTEDEEEGTLPVDPKGNSSIESIGFGSLGGGAGGAGSGGTVGGSSSSSIGAGLTWCIEGEMWSEDGIGEISEPQVVRGLVSVGINNICHASPDSAPHLGYHFSKDNEDIWKIEEEINGEQIITVAIKIR